MSRLMQLPHLYGVRGSIATQTMSNLTDEQKLEIGRIVEMVAGDPGLAADKFEFIKQLSHTIKGDYKSDRDVAEHEFYIAIWRATVYLLYHRDYNYCCSVCGQGSYNTSTNKQKTFDRRYPICPNCNQTYDADGNVCQLSHSSRGYLLTKSDKSTTEYYRRRADIEKLVSSPIKTIHGDRKVEDPQGVLNDPQQRGKWYSTWVWNYFRQILNENIIRTHNKHQVSISGPANQMAARLVLNELRQGEHKHFFDESALGGDDFEIIFSMLQAPLSLSLSLLAICREYKHHDVDITLTECSIRIKAGSNVPIVHATITTEDPVVVLSLDTPQNDNDEAGSWSDILEHNSVAVDTGEDIPHIIESDWVQTIRESLPDEICREVFDIYLQRGEAWVQFSGEYGDRDAAKSHIAKFYHLSPRKIDEYFKQIQMACGSGDCTINGYELPQYDESIEVGVCGRPRMAGLYKGYLGGMGREEIAILDNAGRMQYIQLDDIEDFRILANVGCRPRA